MTTPELHRHSVNGWSWMPTRYYEIASEKEFDELFKTHYEGVYRLLYRIVGTREEAEDLAQETFLRLHKTGHLWRRQRPAESVREGAHDRQHNVRGWLYRVASNLAYNALRDEGRRRRRQEETARQAVVMAREEDDPAVVVARTDDRQAVRRALDTLSRRQAQLLLLRQAGLSYRELAEALGVSPGSVGTLLARAEIAFEKSYLQSASGQGGEHEV